MAIDPRDYIDSDKRFPDSLSGEAGKVLIVDATEETYEHQAISALTGQIIMWPLDTPPSGFLLCDGAAIDPGYTALIALIGANTPNISFPKNSLGVNTGNQVAESVGTHGHSASSPAHAHDVTVNSVANHTHSSSANTTTTVSFMTDSGSVYGTSETGSSTGAAGAHGHTTGTGATAGGTEEETATVTVADHSGTNQPAHTLINFCIKT